ncbi:MAG: lysylphosphatidylglycerol synthase transmembrane domain-containing protein [Nitrospinaceae bacterium]
MSNRKKLSWVLAWVVASFLIYWCVQGVHWDRALSEWKNVHPWGLVLAVLFNLSILAFWAAQWKVFLPKRFHVSFGRMIEINALMAMTLNTVPFLMGQVLGVVLLAKREKVGHAAALSALALDQLAEGFSKISLFLLVATLTPLPAWMKRGILLAVLAILFLVIALFFFAHRFPGLQGSWKDPSHPRLKKVIHSITRWAHYLEALRDFRILFFGLAMALGMKGMEAMAVFMIQKSFGLDLPIWTVFLVLASVSLATMVPVAPGNLGVYEATVFFIYQYLGVSAELALGLALFQHLCFLVPNILPGYLILLIRNFYPLKSRQASLGASLAE